MSDSQKKVVVKLRAMEPEDLDVLYRIENDMALWNVGCTNVPYSRYTLHNYIADNTNDIYTDKQLRLMVENDKGETVGIVDLMNFEPRHQRAELGIVIMDKYRNCGYATAAIKEVIGYARNILHIHQLFAFIDTISQSLHKVRHPAFVVRQRSFIRYREVQEIPNGISNIGDAIFQPANSTLNPVNNAPDNIAAPVPSVGS